MPSLPADIPLYRVHLPPEGELMPALRDCLYSGQISEGEPVYEFERRFAEFVGARDALSFYSGTAALHTALLLAGAGPGDEVITTAMTAEPTNMAILHTGAKVVWADVDPWNGNVTADSIAEVISARTKAIMVVHYGGVPAPMREIRAVAEGRGIPVIEDAAHALGARYGGLPLGAFSDFVMYSLQAIKHMTTVDGGILTCRSAEQATRGRLVRWFGIDRHASRTEVDVREVGYKYHMNNVNATIGLVQLDHIAPIIARHIDNGRYFDEQLIDLPGIAPCRWEQEAEPSYWFYTVLADDPENLQRRLAASGIASSKSHRRNDLHSVFATSRRSLPGLDSFYSRMLHIPCGWWVSNDDRDRIAAVLREVR
jgi:dTDP-4-amino-4,6-dideoxygalactose transaminase